MEKSQATKIAQNYASKPIKPAVFRRVSFNNKQIRVDLSKFQKIAAVEFYEWANLTRKLNEIWPFLRIHWMK